MKWLMNLKIVWKLILGFFIIGLLGGTTGLGGILIIKSLANSDKELYENVTVPIAELGNIATEFQLTRVNLRDFLMTDDPLLRDNYATQIAQRQEVIDKNLKSLDKNITSANLRELYNEMVEKNSILNQMVNYDIELGKEGKMEEVAQLMSVTGSSGIASQELQNAIDKIVKAQIAEAKMKSDSNATQANGATVILIVIMLVSTLVAIGIIVFLNAIISKPVKHLTKVANKLAIGDVAVDIDVKRKAKDELGALISAFERMVENIRDQANFAEKIAAGDLAVTFKAKSDQDVLGKKLVEMQDTIKAIMNETDKLVVTIQEGKLDSRGNAEEFAGGWGTLVSGINNLIDSFAEPFNMAAKYIERIGKGDTPPKITDSYNGDFNEIKNNLNNCIDAITYLVDQTGVVIVAAKNGELSTRANTDGIGGVYRKLLRGINDTMDLVIGPLNVAAEYVDRISKGDTPPKITDSYNGDFNEIKNNLNNCIDAITYLVDQTGVVIVAAKNGELS
ncbi:MAG: MCP four helix bundle domain-containing protein, partial [Desulfosporosinus sp.]